MQQSKSKKQYTKKLSIGQLSQMKKNWAAYHKQIKSAQEALSEVHLYFHFLKTQEQWSISRIAYVFDRSQQRISQIIDRVEKEVKHS